MAYVATLYSASSQWNTVNALYSISTIPRSSAEINLGAAISPGYFDFHSIQNLFVSKSPGIVFTDDDNGGFALLLGLFYGRLDSARVNHSLDWSGDRYTFVMRSGQTYGTLVWALSFNSADAANFMFSNLDNLIRSRHIAGKSPWYSAIDSVADSLSQGITYSYTSSVLTTKLRRVSNQIWWLENTDSLTQPIMNILSAQQTTPTLAKAAASASPPFPMALSSTQKRSVVGGVLRHLFNKRR
jgi:hypothetical protein